MLFKFIYIIISDGVSWPARIVRKFVTDEAGINQKLSMEEWLLLADWENNEQENQHVETKIFNMCMVCYVFMFLLIYIKNFLHRVFVEP